MLTKGIIKYFSTFLDGNNKKYSITKHKSSSHFRKNGNGNKSHKSKKIIHEHYKAPKIISTIPPIINNNFNPTSFSIRLLL